MATTEEMRVICLGSKKEFINWLEKEGVNFEFYRVTKEGEF